MNVIHAYGRDFAAKPQAEIPLCRACVYGNRFKFFAGGALIRSYAIEDLVGNMDMVPMSVSMARWKDWESVEFSSANNTLVLTTIDDLTYTFDITTGEIIENAPPGGIGGFGSAILIILSIGMFICIIFLRTKRNNRHSKRIR